MRAVPLSDDRVISLLNRHFVPVTIANEDFREGGSATPEEKAELQRIRREAGARKLSVGTVHAYVLSPEGEPLDSLHVANAFKVPELIAMLHRAVQKLAVPAGQPVVRPTPRPEPTCARGSLLLHVTARYLAREGNEYVPVRNAGGNWSALPGEDWIELKREAWAGLVPPGSARVGQTWEVAPEVAQTLLNRFYPPTENNDLSKNRIDEGNLKGTVDSVRGGVAYAWIEGTFKMKHPFYHKDDDRFVQGQALGFVEFEARQKTIRRLRLTTDGAFYHGGSGQPLPFGVAVRSLP